MDKRHLLRTKQPYRYLLYQWAGNKKDGDGVLVLSNNQNSLKLFGSLINMGENTVIYGDPVDVELLKAVSPKFVISYNYSHIINKGAIEYMGGRMINIHISMLPWNRGAHPNFWSFIDNTPKGVTIHLIDEGLDTGDILIQKEVSFDENKETFLTTYNALNDAAVALLTEHWDEIVKGKIAPVPQPKGGSYHSRKDFEKFMEGKDFDWNLIISEFKKGL